MRIVNNKIIINDNFPVNLQENLNKYMLYKIEDDDNNDNRENKENISKDIKENITKDNIKENKLPNKFINYNKINSKVIGEAVNNKTNCMSDIFFWCFLKIKFEFNDSMLNYVNHFQLEQENKRVIINQLNTNNTLLLNLFKLYKIKKKNIESDIINNKTISYNTFVGICLLNKINCVIIINDNIYTIINSIHENLKNIKEDDNLYLLKLNYDNYSIQSNTKIDPTKKYNINIEILNEKIDLNKIDNKLYYVKNLDKPINSSASYKVNEIIDIANKLNINTNKENDKKKNKTELYNEIKEKIN